MGRDAAVAIVEKLELPITPDEYTVASSEVLCKLFPTCKLLPGQFWFKHQQFQLYPNHKFYKRTSI